MKHRIVPYRSYLAEHAKELRHSMTLAEVLLWKKLKSKQLCGYDFDRQKPLGNRIVDFYCKELMLAVDVDGCVRDHTREEDERRHEEIEALGVTHPRFWNFDVKNDVASVLTKLETWIRDEERRRGWPRREMPVKISRSRATRNGRSTPDPSKGGEDPSDDSLQEGKPFTEARPPAGSPPGRGQGWVRPRSF